MNVSRPQHLMAPVEKCGRPAAIEAVGGFVPEREEGSLAELEML